MGRHHKKNKKKFTAVSEEAEKEKIRESILKVFRAQVSASDQNGALLVGSAKQVKEKTREAATKNQHTVPKRRHHLNSSSSDSFNEIDSRKDKTSMKRKRRQTKKSEKSEKTKLPPEKETAVNRHMKIAHGITYMQSGKDELQEKNMPIIGPARVTILIGNWVEPPTFRKLVGRLIHMKNPDWHKKVGLIQTGKKSAPAVKAFVVPEHISRVADDEIKKIVSNNNNDSQVTADLDAAESLVLSRCSSGQHIATPASVEMKPKDSHCSSVQSYRSVNSPVQDNNHIETRQIVKEVLAAASLKTLMKQMFPGRDALCETMTDLQKIYRQNAPRSATPNSFPLVRKLPGSGSSIQRSLTESFVSCQENPTVLKDTQSMGQDNKNVTLDCKNRWTSDSQAGYKRQENTELGYKSLDMCLGTRKSGLDFYHKTQNEARCRQEGKMHNNFSASTVPKINFASKNPFEPRSDTRHVHVENVIHKDLPASCEPEYRLNICSERNLKDLRTDRPGNASVSRNSRDNSNLELLYHTAKIMEHQNSWLQQGRSKLKEDVLKSYRANVNQCQEKSADAFTALFGENTSEKSDLFSHACDKAVKDQIFLKRPKSATTGALALLETNDIIPTAVEPMEVDKDQEGIEQLLQFNDILESITSRGNSQSSSDIHKPQTNPKGMTDNEDSNSQYSHCSRYSHSSAGFAVQEQIKSQPGEYMPSIHTNYYADHMPARDLTWQLNRHESHNKPTMDTIDLLDYVDYDQQGGLSRDIHMPDQEETSPDYGILRFKPLEVTVPTSPDSPDIWRHRKMY